MTKDKGQNMQTISATVFFVNLNNLLAFNKINGNIYEQNRFLYIFGGGLSF
jgi:hypothetical protein